MKFWDMMKKYLSVDEEDYIPQSQHELERELANTRHTAKEYKKLALLKNQECVGQARLIDELRRRIDFLENVNKCQAELLAEREV
ncbi:TPA: hypothetical protein TZY74_000053 [Streptococcus suis]|uniref:Uncharacterized protein n=1 Tax=Streptococcus suis TaxID=1307 RepID=A0A7T1P6F2_STRSU|nr:hypothetical protein [Streptococcus suis]MCQ8786128.1 hypothetical protein [Streptococcus suis]MDW8720642.1 hypothetical protein [Streptococcus suis]NQN64235.1 hypothetical protein [Streptococcus suis]NQR44526.1 hypothetical protein [Streptococcus suis]NQR54006.1 hypothetical protein [Streptococcus suis]